MNRVSLLSLLALVALSIIGCGPNGPVVVPVTGVVKLDGEPVEGAGVIFMPAEAGRLPAEGTTDAQGKFSLRTSGASVEGAIAGKYDVVVTKVSQPTGVVNEDGTSGGISNMKVVWLIPQKYSKHTTSGLQATVLKNMPLVELKLSTK